MPGATAAVPRGEQTRHSILDAAERLFLDNGYNGTSMRQIAQAAGGIAVGGIYNHFTSKEDIFHALVEARSPYPRIIAELDKLDGTTGPELIRQAFSRLQTLAVENAGFFGLVMIDVREFGGSTIRSLIGSAIPHFLRFGRRVKLAGGIRHEVDILVLIRTFAILMSGYVLSHIVAFSHGEFALPGVPREMSSVDPAAWEDLVVEVFLHGVAAPPEKQL